jgi:hypothetical protein
MGTCACAEKCGDFGLPRTCSLSLGHIFMIATGNLKAMFAMHSSR